MKPPEAQTGPLTPEEELAVAEQRLKCLTEQREVMMERMERMFRRIRYAFYGQWVMIALWVYANHFWK